MATGLGRSEKNTETGSSIPLARSRWIVESAGEVLTRPAVEAIKEAESQSYWNDHQSESRVEVVIQPLNKSFESFKRPSLYQLTDKDWDVF
jgi:hypothetical protein